MNRFGVLRAALEIAPGDRKIAVAVRDEVAGVHAAVVVPLEAGRDSP